MDVCSSCGKSASWTVADAVIVCSQKCAQHIWLQLKPETCWKLIEPSRGIGVRKGARTLQYYAGIFNWQSKLSLEQKATELLLLSPDQLSKLLQNYPEASMYLKENSSSKPFQAVFYRKCLDLFPLHLGLLVQKKDYRDLFGYYAFEILYNLKKSATRTIESALEKLDDKSYKENLEMSIFLTVPTETYNKLVHKAVVEQVQRFQKLEYSPSLADPGTLSIEFIIDEAKYWVSFSGLALRNKNIRRPFVYIDRETMIEILWVFYFAARFFDYPNFRVKRKVTSESARAFYNKDSEEIADAKKYASIVGLGEALVEFGFIEA